MGEVYSDGSYVVRPVRRRKSPKEAASFREKSSLVHSKKKKARTPPFCCCCCSKAPSTFPASLSPLCACECVCLKAACVFALCYTHLCLRRPVFLSASFSHFKNAIGRDTENEKEKESASEGEREGEWLRGKERKGGGRRIRLWERGIGSSAGQSSRQKEGVTLQWEQTHLQLLAPCAVESGTVATHSL